MNGPLPDEGDTIVALSSAPGRSAIAVVRLSGSAAFSIAKQIVSPWPLAARRAVLCHVIDPADQSLIDQPVVVSYPGPHSYTGEDTVEFSTHGGHAVPTALVQALLHAGAREAYAGEFTRRALLNGKLDLVQAEAIGDLIDASTDAMRRVVLHQLDGGLSRQIEELRSRLIDIEALLAYDIDFPEEDHGPLARDRIRIAGEAVGDALEGLLATAPATELVRDGAIVVIAGRPNVGKSSLFNAIIGEMRAIVTDIPGTTRDAIEARVELNGWPVRLVDTAGLRTTHEVIEQLGIEVSERYLANAHAIIACDEDLHRLEETVDRMQARSAAPVIAVVTKSDRHPAEGNGHHGAAGSSSNPVRVSAQTRMGLHALSLCVREILEDRYGAIPVSQPALTRARQRIAVERARNELSEFQRQWEIGELPATVAAVHIRAAAGALDELIGAVDTEDVLERVFATFCIGK